ncbi:hypothetical protein KGF54_004635 [Candida jiufengensis]|uniref:uncharacterized protein n=1 Tax=Candida jiufengensis TaxID=497108 RepID=UPI002224F5AB|nr:uncharacterized protein KGF54_004635 [Candida jiufengensis]KAI5951561.1 hypothetical protein KGF54_004635 [Candida jiufengensis]
MTKFYSKRLLLKLLLLSTIICTIFISIKSILVRPTIKQYQKQLNEQIKFKYNEIYYNFLETNYDLNNDIKFNEKINNILNFLFSKDDENKYWDLNPYLIKNLPLKINIPDYYFDESILKPKIQEFDPSFTIGMYYHYIINSNMQNLNDLSVPFHWSDWVDLTSLNKFIFPPSNNINFDDTKIQHSINQCSKLFNISSNETIIKGSQIKNIDEYCKYDPFTLIGYEIFSEPGQQSIENRKLIGKSYLLQNAPSPNKLIFLTSNNSYQINIDENEENDISNALLRNEMVELSELKSIDLLNSYSKLLLIPPTPSIYEPLQDQLIHIPESNFNIDPNEVISNLLNQEHKTAMDKQFLQSLQFSYNHQDPPKYFYEASLLKSIPDSWQGEHYDWRFFNGITLGNDEQAIILHRLIKNYLNFARNHGIVTWIAHGSLLSWYWNGMAFPWDTDIDVQVPIADLYKLGQYYNQTIIVENVADHNGEFDGMGRYFMDVGSSITHRTKGNGNNAIDARFIDLDTGLYIDITALALTDSNSPERYRIQTNYIEDENSSSSSSSSSKSIKNFGKVNKDLQLYNCRNEHFASYNEISPLRKSLVENQISYIPKNFLNMLNNEYNMNSIIKKFHRNFTYLKNLRLWINTKYIKKSIGIKTINDENITFKEMVKLNKISTKQIVMVLNEYPKFLKEWLITKNFTNLHNMELKILKNNNLENYDPNNEGMKKINQLINSNINSIGKSLRPDYFMDKLMMNNNDV